MNAKLLVSRIAAATLAVNLFGLTAPAQSSATPGNQAASNPAPASHSGPFVVHIPVTLRDRKGRLLTSYPTTDLTLSDNGHPQTIQSFEHPQNEPMRIGILIDTSSGQQSALDSERAASARFVDQMLARPNTKVFLLHFDHEVELLQDFTTSSQKLHTELSEMTTSAPQQPSAASPVGSVGKTTVRGGAEVYDAVYLAARELMAPEHGRKLMVIFTSGFDHGSKVGLNEAIDAAQRAQVSVFTLYVKSEGPQPKFGNNGQNQRPGMGYPGRFPGGGYPGGGYPGGGYPGGGYPGSQPGGNSRQNSPAVAYGDGKKTLEQIAVRSGGRYFEDIRKDDYDEAFHEIVDELNAQFALTYAPNDLSDDSFSDGFHKISLRAKDKSMFVITTEGYFEPSSGTPAKSAGK